MSALEARRQAAREAYHGKMAELGERTITRMPAIETAIETATRVRITHEIVMAFMQAPDDPDDIAGPIAAAFRAAGFEIEESAFVCPPWCGVDGPKCANPKHHKPDSGAFSFAEKAQATGRAASPDQVTPIADHVYRGGNQIGDLCNHVYPIEGDGWPGMRCATPESAHLDRHPQQAPRKDTLPS